MKTLYATIIASILFGSLAFCDQVPPLKNATELFEDFKSRNFVPQTSILANGWMMDTSNGSALQRSFLLVQVEQVTSLGLTAFPEILSNLTDKEMYIRYIAAESARRISGEDPVFMNFGTLENNGEQIQNAKKHWEDWYTRQNQNKKENKMLR